MGYHTEFQGVFNLDKPLDPETLALLKGLATTRRMKRKLGPEYGIDGEFYVEGGGFMGQDSEENVVDHNHPPGTQPSLWCQWVPNDAGTELGWDGGEKFYCYIEWIEYLIDRILKPRGYEVNGKVEWQGENLSDTGVIVVENNVVRARG